MAAPDAKYVRTLLYGGAMSVELPSNLLDVSNMRIVPDNQEVFVERDGFSSFIVELLEFQPEAATFASPYGLETPSNNHASGDETCDATLRALDFFFHDLEDTNEADPAASQVLARFCASSEELAATLDTSISSSPGATCGVLEGVQVVEKWRRHAPDAATEAQPTGHADAVHVFLALVRLPAVGTDLLVTVNVPPSALDTDAAESKLEAYRAAAHHVLKTLTVHDYALFGTLEEPSG